MFYKDRIRSSMTIRYFRYIVFTIINLLTIRCFWAGGGGWGVKVVLRKREKPNFVNLGLYIKQINKIN